MERKMTYGIVVVCNGISVTGLGRTTEMISMYVNMESIGVTTYIMSGWGTRKYGKTRTGEAGWKYIIVGAITSSWMLIGIGTIYRKTGMTEIGEIENIRKGENTMITIAILIKIGVYPLHMWWPGVFYGTPTGASWYYATVLKIVLIWILIERIPNKITEKITIMIGTSTIWIGTTGGYQKIRVKQIIGYSALVHTGMLLYCKGNMINYWNYISWYIGIIYGMYEYGIYSSNRIEMRETREKEYRLVEKEKKRNGRKKEKGVRIEKKKRKAGNSVRTWQEMTRRNKGYGQEITILLLGNAGIPPMTGFIVKWEIYNRLNNNKEIVGIMMIYSTIIAIGYSWRLLKWIKEKECK